jgi:threonyl-tRNA synthetase
VGDPAQWDAAEATLKGIVESIPGLNWSIGEGEAAFYGPKIDFVVRDSLRRKWQLGTIQLDFSMPGRFGLEYIGADGQKHTPVMIHRAILGSFERFIGVLIEHTAGKFPLWLAPQQALVLSISEKYNAYGHSIIAELKQHGLRAALDERDERIARKIRDAEVAKVPYMLIIGEKEAADGAVTLRRQGEGDLGQFTVAEAIRLLNEAVQASMHMASTATHATPATA